MKKRSLHVILQEGESDTYQEQCRQRKKSIIIKENDINQLSPIENIPLKNFTSIFEENIMKRGDETEENNSKESTRFISPILSPVTERSPSFEEVSKRPSNFENVKPKEFKNKQLNAIKTYENISRSPSVLSPDVV